MALFALLLSNMQSYSIYVAVACLILSYIVYRYCNAYKGRPPGPWGFPVIGYLPFLGKEVHKELHNLAKKYGPVISMQIGTKQLIVLDGYDTIKEAFVKFGDLYAGKPNNGIEAEFGDHKSVFITEGEEWREQRRFLLSTMRDFGFGKSSMQEHVQHEAQLAVQELLSKGGKPYELKILARLITTNVVSCLVFGYRFAYNDPDITEKLANLFRDVDFSYFNVIDAFPILERLPQKWTGFDKITKLKKEFYDFVDKIVEEHEKTFDENNIRDLIDVYIVKIRQLNKNNAITNRENINIFTRDHMRANAMILFGAGVNNTSNTSAWMCKLMAAYPEVQKRVQKEIDEVIGSERVASMDDRNRMPYTEAVILECHRFISIVPVTFLHRITDDTTLNGYKIPQNAMVVANLWSIHFDPIVWKDPAKFLPERFLGDDGKILKLRDYVVPFSLGKRNCLGESLAKMELFIFFATFLQKVWFKPPDGEKLAVEPDFYLPAARLKSNTLCAIPRDKERAEISVF